jgi:hypothetical protein
VDPEEVACGTGVEVGPPGTEVLVGPLGMEVLVGWP